MISRHHRGILKRAAVVVLSRGMQAVLLYRLAHLLYNKQVPVLPFVLARLSHHLYAVDIAPSAKIGPGLVLVHCFGTVIGSAVEIEGNCVIFHGVTLGDRGSEWVGTRETDGHPVIGRDCILGAGAKILGPVRVGQNCVVGANSVVITDIPENSVAAGLPAKVVNTRPVMDADLRPIDGVYREDAERSINLIEDDPSQQNASVNV
jgi:serine O-acetyltransferase